VQTDLLEPYLSRRFNLVVSDVVALPASQSPDLDLMTYCVPLTGCISGGKGHLDKRIGQQTGVMQDDANPDSGAGAGSRGGTVRNAIGNGAGGSGNPRRSKRQRKEEDDQGMAGEDPGMHMACMVYIASCAGISAVVLLQPWDPVTVTSGTDWKYCFGGRNVCRENQQGDQAGGHGKRKQ
jgi:hypothetical protein